MKSPKLYFFDVGLAAQLLGTRSETHVHAHPLRGASFESLVVAEALKFYWHRGRRAGLHFRRDSEGNEVDLLPDLPNGVFPVEVKAGETVRAELFGGLRRFAKLYHRPPPNGGALVCAGTESHERSGVGILPPEGLLALLDLLGSA